VPTAIAPSTAQAAPTWAARCTGADAAPRQNIRSENGFSPSSGSRFSAGGSYWKLWRPNHHTSVMARAGTSDATAKRIRNGWWANHDSHQALRSHAPRPHWRAPMSRAT
jgi:hypothetical protein